MKYDIQFTNQFKKDLKLAKKQNKNLDKLFEVIDILANGGTLEAKYRDHDLTGNYKGTRECHIEPDWLLIYEIRGEVLVLMLYRLASLNTGTTDELKYAMIFVSISFFPTAACISLGIVLYPFPQALALTLSTSYGFKFSSRIVFSSNIG